MTILVLGVCIPTINTVYFVGDHTGNWVWMDCVPNELMLVIDGVIVVQFQMTYGCNMYVWSHI